MRAFFKKFKWFLLSPLILYVLVALIFFPPIPSRIGGIKTIALESQSLNHLRVMGQLILDYRSNHGWESPERLSEIVPDDQLDSYLVMFYIPNKPPSEKPANRLTDKHLLDTSCDYMLPAKANSGILVSEKPGLWSDNMVGVCFDDLTVRRLKRAEFDALGK